MNSILFPEVHLTKQSRHDRKEEKQSGICISLGSVKMVSKRIIQRITYFSASSPQNYLRVIPRQQIGSMNLRLQVILYRIGRYLVTGEREKAVGSMNKMLVIGIVNRVARKDSECWFWQLQKGWGAVNGGVESRNSVRWVSQDSCITTRG